MNKPKWTEERVREHLISIMDNALRPEVNSLHSALMREGLYIDIWAYWKKIFAANEEVIVAMKRIETAFQAKLFEGGLDKSMSCWMAMFGLRYSYGWNTDNDPAEKAYRAYREQKALKGGETSDARQPEGPKAYNTDEK